MRYLGCQQAEDQAKAQEEKEEEKVEGGEEIGAEEEGEKHDEEATADKLRAQLEKLADQVRASSCVEDEYGNDSRTDWTETESDKEFRKTLEVAIKKKVSLEKLDFSSANLANMK